MSNKRLLVRLINHSTGFDRHHMIDIQDCPIAIHSQIETYYQLLTHEAGQPANHNLGDLVERVESYGNAQHSTLLTGGWLVQLRIDAAKTMPASNDNIPEIKERHA